jgi:hypothetical protein
MLSLSDDNELRILVTAAKDVPVDQRDSFFAISNAAQDQEQSAAVLPFSSA